MVEIKPLSPWRYDPERVELQDVIAPPYDVIDSKEQEMLYEKSPFNIVRLILGKDEQGDTEEGQNKYKRAASFLESWRKQGICVQDTEPAFYLYRQTFPHPETQKKTSRIGIFGLLRLEDYSSRNVLPHERTHQAPKQDRMNLIRSVQGNLSPVFGLYEDADRRLDSIFKLEMKRKPLIQFSGDESTTHEIWLLKEKSAIEKICSFFNNQSVMIADGHHRYETALAYRNWLRENGAVTNGRQAFDYVMMVLVNIHDEGLIVFPTHRMLKLRALPEFDHGSRVLAPYFTINSFHASSAEDWASHLTLDPKGGVEIGLQWGRSKGILLTLRNEQEIKKLMPEGKPDAWYRLDVNIVSHVIIHKIFGIAPEQIEKVISYTRDLDEAVKRVQQGEATVAIILREPDVATVKTICHSGEVMPEKSTYFYPKLPSGLLLYLHET